MTGEESRAMRVLLVEDSSEMRALVRYWLEGDERFEIVAEAADGATAVRLSEELQPDVVVLDLYLPVLGGVSALPRIREVAGGAKVIVISGAGDPENRSQEALGLGAAAYVEKVEFVSTLQAVAAACLRPVVA